MPSVVYLRPACLGRLPSQQTSSGVLLFCRLMQYSFNGRVGRMDAAQVCRVALVMYL